MGLQGQWQKNERVGYEFLLPEFTGSSIGAFLFEEFKRDNQITFTGGIRLDYADRNIMGHQEPIYSDESTIERYYTRNDSINKEFFNWAGALGISYYPTRQFNAKLNLGTSFKVPTAAELGLNGIHHGTFRHELGNESLTSERGLQWDLGLHYQLPNFNVSLTPFISLYNNFIYLAPTTMFSSSLDDVAFPEGGQVYRYKQGDTFFTGGELFLGFHPIDEVHTSLGAEYVYNYHFEENLPLPFTPPASLYLEADYELPIKTGWLSHAKVGGSYKNVLAQNRVYRNESTTPGYQLIGLNISCKVKIFAHPVDFGFTVQNLLNSGYYNHLSRYRILNLPEQGRNFNFFITIPFAVKRQ